MDFVYWIQGLAFEWDREKARANIQKHDVRFEEASEAFLDPFYQSGDASTEDEARDFLLGYSMSQRLLLVVYTNRSSRKRLISARLATRAERQIYEGN